MPESKPRVLLSWSSGKDSAWALHHLKRRDDIEVVGLLTTFNERFDRVAMHAVRRELVLLQAEATGLPLRAVMLPFPCSNALYEQQMKLAIGEAVAAGVSQLAFGDLHLADVRDYRIKLLEGTGLAPLFPIWTTAADSPRVARAMQAARIEATLTCVDPSQLSPDFLGRRYDSSLLAELPNQVDPCGENGEFHTFCTASPDFNQPISAHLGDKVCRDGFWFADLLPVTPGVPNHHKSA